MKTISIGILVTAILTFFGNDPLIGKWQTKPSPTGNTTGVVFKTDNSFDGYINKKPFVTGRYTLQDSIFSFTDNGCNGAKGVYKIIFFSQGDSIRFEPISDSCVERMKGMSKSVFGRVK